MNKSHGFSLTEVVVSLFLVTCLLFTSLKYQWQIRSLFNQLQHQMDEFYRSENAREQLLSNFVNQQPIFRKDLGISLLELLIALFLSSFVILSLMHLYLAIKPQYLQIQQDINERIELQFVSQLFQESIKQAGFTPCSSIHYLETIDQRAQEKPLSDIEINHDGYVTLRLGRMHEEFDTLLNVINPFELLATRLHPLSNEKSVVIADCYHAEVQHVKQVRILEQTQRVTLNKPLAFNYHAPIYIGEWVEEFFYARSKNSKSSGLFYGLGHAEELTSLIHHLRATFDNYQKNTLLKIIFDLKDGKSIELDTMIRMR